MDNSKCYFDKTPLSCSCLTVKIARAVVLEKRKRSTTRESGKRRKSSEIKDLLRLSNMTRLKNVTSLQQCR